MLLLCLAYLFALYIILSKYFCGDFVIQFWKKIKLMFDTTITHQEE